MLTRLFVTLLAGAGVLLVGLLPSDASPIRWPYLAGVFVTGLAATIWNWLGLRAAPVDRLRGAGIAALILSLAWAFLSGFILMILIAHELTSSAP